MATGNIEASESNISPALSPRASSPIPVFLLFWHSPQAQPTFSSPESCLNPTNSWGIFNPENHLTRASSNLPRASVRAPSTPTFSWRSVRDEGCLRVPSGPTTHSMVLASSQMSCRKPIGLLPLSQPALGRGHGVRGQRGRGEGDVGDSTQRSLPLSPQPQLPPLHHRWQWRCPCQQVPGVTN